VRHHEEEMAGFQDICATLAAAVAFCLSISAAGAGGVEPGLWKITSRTQTGGVIGPPHVSSKCLSAKEASDVPTTFSPVARTVNSACAPIERSYDGKKLNWRLICKGELNMELKGEFIFDTPRHYTAVVQSKADMLGHTMVDSQETLEAYWVSECAP
jgi:Protein of unknown function (DUF3617)